MVFKTLKRIQENFYWPGMSRQVRDYIRKCETCARYKVEQKAPRGLMHTMQCSAPWQLIGPLPRSKKGKTSLLVIIDRFSRYVELVPKRRATAQDVMEALKERVIYRFGCPETFLTDNGVHFTSRLVQQFLKDLHI